MGDAPCFFFALRIFMMNLCSPKSMERFFLRRKIRSAGCFCAEFSFFRKRNIWGMIFRLMP
ncbi:hypothetical protein BEQ56_05020 [Anaerolineaceae bacterium oral taxon 439]|nr:hypothetical protein BEQ56_05020 [Anaerolineaceae bacterium oral taxon 439]